MIDYSKIATQANVYRTSSLRFYEILEDTLIAERIGSYQVVGADTIRHPKLYFFDVGVLNGILNNFSVSADRVGNLFEHLVYNQIRNSAFALDKKTLIQFFRTRHGIEVDFIVELGRKKYAIEVKTGQITPSDCQSLLALKKYDPTVDELFIVGLKETGKRKIKDVTICGVTELLKSLGL